MRRGEVRWADLPPPLGRRPVVLLSRDEAYSRRNLIIVAPVTTRIRGIPAEVRLGSDDGVSRESVANLDTIMTIPKSSIQDYIASLSLEKLRAVEEAIHFALRLQH